MLGGCRDTLTRRKDRVNPLIGKSSSRKPLHPCRFSSRKVRTHLTPSERFSSDPREWTTEVKIHRIAPNAISGRYKFDIHQSCRIAPPGIAIPHLQQRQGGQRPSSTLVPAQMRAQTQHLTHRLAHRTSHIERIEAPRLPNPALEHIPFSGYRLRLR